ncbi:MAG TPA: helix-turn-helix domain-containing protein, partial [Myxococcota bacterium]
RELRNLMERLVIMCPDATIGPASIPDTLRTTSEKGAGERRTLEEARRRFEREFLLSRLTENAWNISRTAEAIGIARESLSRKIKAHQLEVERG